VNGRIGTRILLVALCCAVLGCAGITKPSRQNPADYSVLESAVEGCNLDQTRAIIATSPQLVNKQGWNRTTPLYLAAQNNCLEVVRFLLKSGAPVDSRSTTGATPLHIAAQKGNIAIASLLLLHHADINAVDSQHRTPLDRALAWEHADMAAFLARQGGRSGNQ
jgi:ankyrin repeat protein